jgi:hypothetical protein
MPRGTVDSKKEFAIKAFKFKIFRLFIETLVEFDYAPESEVLRVIPRGSHGLSCVAKLLFSLRLNCHGGAE